MEKGSGFELLSGLLVGGIAGFVLGLLVAPQPGTRTRERLGEQVSDAKLSTNELIESVRGNTESLLNTARASIEEKLNRLSEAMEAGRKAAEAKKDELAQDNG
ncbi:MAG: YtxH domain-containing protein [Bacteroidota bacterium]